QSISTYPAWGPDCEAIASASVVPEARFDFTYVAAPISGRSRLSSLEVKGAKGNAAPVRRSFSYYDGNWTLSDAQPTLKLARRDAYDRKNQFGDLHTYRRTFADVTGDGIPELCVSGGADRFYCLTKGVNGIAFSKRIAGELASQISKDVIGSDATV